MAALKKADVENRKAEMVNKARKYLPFPSISKADSDTLHEKFPMLDFVRINDDMTFDKTCESLRKSSILKVFQEIANTFNCDPNEVCLIESRVIERKKIKTPVTYFRYRYNPSFNSVLKSSAYAVFDSLRKAWNIELSEEAADTIARNIADYFKVVIDVDTMLIMQNKRDAVMSSVSDAAFIPMPFHVPIHKRGIIAAINDIRPSDDVLHDKMYIHNGEHFVLFPPEDNVWTQAPFLLIRYGVSGRQPRYISFSTIGQAVEHISFSHGDKVSSYAIARFAETCRRTGKPAYTTNESEVIHQTPELTNKLHGEFSRFSADIEHINNHIPDMHFALLSSDYVTLMDKNHGADSSDLVAYVHSRESKQHGYLSKIASFFGYANTDYPIIFTRSVMANWDAENDCHFLSTIAHELAHWLVGEREDEFLDESIDDHGIAWAVCNDLMAYIFLEEYAMTEYERYHRDQGYIIREIEEAVTEIGITAIDTIRRERLLNRQDIKDVTHLCLSSIPSYGVKDIA